MGGLVFASKARLAAESQDITSDPIIVHSGVM